MMTSGEEPGQGAEGVGVSVLLVDDDPWLRSLLVRGLERRGFEVRPAATAEEALRVVADPSVSIDVIVMDIVLPDSWGGQVAMEQSLFRPGTPVIFISGHTRDDIVLRASSGQEETTFLEKPFGVAELSQAILTRLGKDRVSDPG